MIEDFGFGWIIIDGKKYASDLIIYPEGRIETGWKRMRGHRLSISDISELLESEPEIVIAGTGVAGLVQPEKDLRDLLVQRGAEFVSAPNDEAVSLYNEMAPKKRVAACFHLTC
jgi:hypothetical protein